MCVCTPGEVHPRCWVSEDGVRYYDLWGYQIEEKRKTVKFHEAHQTATVFNSWELLVADWVGFANSPVRVIVLCGGKRWWHHNMPQKALETARSEGKNLLCAQRGEESPHLLHLENAGMCTEMQAPARNLCWSRGVFDMNTVILKCDRKKNKRWKKWLHHLSSTCKFSSNSSNHLEAQKCRAEVDCRRPSRLTPPHRDKNEFNSHGKKKKKIRIIFLQAFVQSICRGDLLCKGDEAHFTLCLLRPPLQVATVNPGSLWLISPVPLAPWFVFPHRTPANIAAAGQEGEITCLATGRGLC